MQFALAVEGDLAVAVKDLALLLCAKGNFAGYSLDNGWTCDQMFTLPYAAKDVLQTIYEPRASLKAASEDNDGDDNTKRFPSERHQMVFVTPDKIVIENHGRKGERKHPLHSSSRAQVCILRYDVDSEKIECSWTV